MRDAHTWSELNVMIEREKPALMQRWDEQRWINQTRGWIWFSGLQQATCFILHPNTIDGNSSTWTKRNTMQINCNLRSCFVFCSSFVCEWVHRSFPCKCSSVVCIVNGEPNETKTIIWEKLSSRCCPISCCCCSTATCELCHVCLPMRFHCKQ